MTPLSSSANIIEVFSSLQGEGPYAGERMTFVRFGGCSLCCRFCDTPQGQMPSEACRAESRPGSAALSEIKNPVSAARLGEVLASFDDDTISVTGGEPLEQAEFLAEWLPSVSSRRRILLETNGTLHEELRLVLPYVHVVSMDIKLPSSTGARPLWDEHLKFLHEALASGRELYVKAVVTPATTDRDIQRAIEMISRANKRIPVIIQPASPLLGILGPVAEERLRSIERLCQAFLPNARILPQMHREWGVL